MVRVPWFIWYVLYVMQYECTHWIHDLSHERPHTRRARAQPNRPFKHNHISGKFLLLARYHTFSSDKHTISAYDIWDIVCLSEENVWYNVLCWEFSIWSFLYWCRIGSGIPTSLKTILIINKPVWFCNKQHSLIQPLSLLPYSLSAETLLEGQAL